MKLRTFLLILQNYRHTFKHPFMHFQQTEEQIRLLRHQRRLEDDTGHSYGDLSLQQTLHKLIVDGNLGHVEKLRKEFKVPEKRFWMLKVNALAEVGDWGELEKMSKVKKPPVSLEVFVDAALKHGNRTEAMRFVVRVPQELKVKCLVKCR